MHHTFRRNQTPLPYGLSSGGTAEAVDPVQQRRLKIAGYRSLAGVADEFAFYTPAIVHLYGNLTFDPLTEFIRDYGKDAESFSMSFSKPVFSGLDCEGDESWNYVLYAMPHEHWPHYLNWLQGVGLCDEARKLFLRIRHTELRVADPLQMEYQAFVRPDTATIAVHGLALETNAGSYYLNKPQDPLMHLPKLSRLPPSGLSSEAFVALALHPESVAAPQLQNLQMPVTQRFEDLPEEKRRELLLAMQEFKQGV